MTLSLGIVYLPPEPSHLLLPEILKYTHVGKFLN